MLLLDSFVWLYRFGCVAACSVYILPISIPPSRYSCCFSIFNCRHEIAHYTDITVFLWRYIVVGNFLLARLSSPRAVRPSSAPTPSAPAPVPPLPRMLSMRTDVVSTAVAGELAWVYFRSPVGLHDIVIPAISADCLLSSVNANITRRRWICWNDGLSTYSCHVCSQHLHGTLCWNVDDRFVAYSVTSNLGDTQRAVIKRSNSWESIWFWACCLLSVLQGEH